MKIFEFKVPTISPQERKAFNLLGFSDHEAIKLLTIIGYSTTKVFWKLADNKSYKVPGFPYNTWILGLPRKSKDFQSQEFGIPYFDITLYEDQTSYKRVKWNVIKTGYSHNNVDRRIGAIAIKPIKRLSKDSWIIILYGFLSKDWYDIYHYGVTPPPKAKVSQYIVKKHRIKASSLVNDAFKEAWVMLKKIYGVK